MNMIMAKLVRFDGEEERIQRDFPGHVRVMFGSSSSHLRGSSSECETQSRCDGEMSLEDLVVLDLDLVKDGEIPPEL